MRIEFHENKPFYWLKYQQLIKDLPVLKISTKKGLRLRLEKLEKCGVLDHYFKTDKGSYSFYAVGNNFKHLIDTEGRNENSEGCEPKFRGVGTKILTGCEPKFQQGANQNSNQKINLLKDSSIKDTNTKIEIDWKSILTAWNALPDPIKNIQAITDARKNKIIARVNSLNLQFKDILQAVNNIRKSNFLQGKNDKGWVITFDWLFKDDTRFSKVLEENYSNPKSNIQVAVNTNLQNAAAYEPFKFS